MRSITIKLAAALLCLGASGVSSAAYIENLGVVDSSGEDFSRSFGRFFGFGDPLGAGSDTYGFTLLGAAIRWAA